MTYEAGRERRDRHRAVALQDRRPRSLPARRRGRRLHRSIHPRSGVDQGVGHGRARWSSFGSAQARGGSRDGWMASRDARRRGPGRRGQGGPPDRSCSIECDGLDIGEPTPWSNVSGPGTSSTLVRPASAFEVVLRGQYPRDRTGATVNSFCRELARALAAAGPPGIAGYAAGRPTPRPAFGSWPAVGPQDLASPGRRTRDPHCRGVGRLAAVDSMFATASSDHGMVENRRNAEPSQSYAWRPPAQGPVAATRKSLEHRRGGPRCRGLRLAQAPADRVSRRPSSDPLGIRTVRRHMSCHVFAPFSFVIDHALAVGPAVRSDSTRKGKALGHHPPGDDARRCKSILPLPASGTQAP